MATYLVTGGAGFIGSHLVRGLLDRGEKVRVVDNFSTGKRENLLPFKDEVELIEGDICDRKVLYRALEGVDFCLHQAALPSVSRSVKTPLLTNKVNIEGTLNLLWVARELGVKRVVYAASSSVYGNSPILPRREDLLPDPLSPYAVSKLGGEQYCRLFTSLFGLETVILRYFNIFGPRQNPRSLYSAVIPKFIYRLLNNSPPIIYGDGKQSRDFTYVDNVVEANLLACKAEGVQGKVINIGCGQSTTLGQLVDYLKQIMDIDIAPRYTSPRTGDVRHSWADISRAEQLLGYKPRVDLGEGLKRTVAWFKRYYLQGN